MLRIFSATLSAKIWYTTDMKVFKELTKRHPSLAVCEASFRSAYGMLIDCYQSRGKVLVCGNGGSAADADHIAGELLNKFKKSRAIDPNIAAKLPQDISDKLVGVLPAISLVAMSATISSISNDSSWDIAFAQQVYGLGNKGDVLIAISTSGNSSNCINAARVAKAMGLHVVALTGEDGGILATLSDVAIRVPERETFKIQELHLPIYHALCAALEDALF